MGALRILFLSLTLAICGLSASPMTPSHENQWQEAKNISGNFKAITAHPDIEVFSAPNVVMIKVNRELKVNIFTILGKLLSSETLTPGIYQYEIESHGVYIIKTDDTSCKLAL